MNREHFFATHIFVHAKLHYHIPNIHIPMHIPISIYLETISSIYPETLLLLSSLTK